MFLPVQVIILLKLLVYLFPIVSGLIKLLLRASRHVVYIVWTQVVILYEIVAHSSITMFLD